VKDTIFLITARGGSKGIPGKNIKMLGDKPLICYSIDFARKFASDEDICVSTDSQEIKTVVENYGLKVPFLRPQELATDTVGSYDVMVHALNWYKDHGKEFSTLVLLQPTSPYRLPRHFEEASGLYLSGMFDMVVSVKKVKSNIFSTYYTETDGGYIRKLFQHDPGKSRRQDSENIFELNGSIYLMRVSALLKTRPGEFDKTGKFEMDARYSADIDDPEDWDWCEYLLRSKLIEI
jgi:CMP-N,N'-diacetyllegionaminic acid synthase